MKGDSVFRFTFPRVFEQGLGEEGALLEMFRFATSVLLMVTDHSRRFFNVQMPHGRLWETTLDCYVGCVSVRVPEAPSGEVSADKIGRLAESL